MNANKKKEETRKELLDRLEAYYRLQLMMILVPVHCLLVNTNQERLYNAIYDITENTSERIENILAFYEIGAIDSPKYKIARMVEELSQDDYFGKVTIGLQDGKITSIKKEESLRLEEL